MFKLCNKWRKIFIRIRKIKNVAINIAIYLINIYLVQKNNEEIEKFSLNMVLNPDEIESVADSKEIRKIVLKSSTSSLAQLKKVLNLINSRPRKCLNYVTSEEKFLYELEKLKMSQ